MPIPHVYEKVAEKTDIGGQTEFVLEDGTCLGLPMSAYGEYEKIEVGDRMLVDLTDWETEKELASIKVFRESYLITQFGVGHNCTLESPALNK